MRRVLRFAVAEVLVALCLGSCHNLDSSGSAESNAVALVFRIELNQQVYQNSAWGDPPQMAIWLQNASDGSIRTVAVTHRTGAGDWEGKVECSIALPCWVTFYNRETATTGAPTWNQPAPDAVTCATPRADFDATIEVPRGSRWAYFVEVNVSGDYNLAFPSLSEAGISDRYGNGQPSIVYRGSIEATEGRTSQPELWGRTDQYIATGEVTADLEQISTARKLLGTITASCAASPRQ